MGAASAGGDSKGAGPVFPLFPSGPVAARKTDETASEVDEPSSEEAERGLPSTGSDQAST